jgi:hypothetical protein
MLQTVWNHFEWLVTALSRLPETLVAAITR